MYQVFWCAYAIIHQSGCQHGQLCTWNVQNIHVWQYHPADCRNNWHRGLINCHNVFPWFWALASTYSSKDGEVLWAQHANEPKQNMKHGVASIVSAWHEQVLQTHPYIWDLLHNTHDEGPLWSPHHIRIQNLLTMFTFLWLHIHCTIMLHIYYDDDACSHTEWTQLTLETHFPSWWGHSVVRIKSCYL